METDKQILKVARRIFLDKGIVATEMKDIAFQLGCSRSTLYRHFASKNDILLALAHDAVLIVNASIYVPANLRFPTGYDALKWQINSYMEALITHVDEVSFLRDFDCMYSKEYPKTKETDAFIELVNINSRQDPLTESIQRGIEDGSIRAIENPELLAQTLLHSLLAIAQRIMPRESLHIAEHKYGQEIIRYLQNMLLEAVKGT